MPTSFSVLAPYDQRGWQLKIRDKERVEPPHVSILYKTRCWRFGLRERDLLDEVPPRRAVPRAILDDITARTDEFARAWNQLYPENPVNSVD